MNKTALIPLAGIWSIEAQAGNLMAAQINGIDPSIFVSDKFLGFFDDDESDESKKGYSVEAGVATIGLQGPMIQKSSWLSRWFGYAGTDDFARAVTDASNDPQVKAILIDFDTPGGNIAGVAEAADAVKAARKDRKMPVYGHVSNQCCSAGLMIASQCDKLYGGQTAQIGSIGAYMVLTDSSQLAEKMGVKVHVISSGPYKGAGVSGSSLTEPQLAEFQRGINTISDIFQGYVAQGRGMKREAVASLADGRSWIGKEAQSKNLIDGVVPRADVLSAMQAYQPGRKAIHIAADAAKETEKMAEEVTSAAEQARQADQLKALEAQLEAERKANAEAQAQMQKEMAETRKALEMQRHREVVMGLMHDGKLPKADVEKHVERRAKCAELYDEMMAERIATPLAQQAARERAVSASAVAESMEQGNSLADQVVGLFRSSRGGNN